MSASTVSHLNEPQIGRVERKRRDARARILNVAESLMRAGPVDEITIADITAAADIGHGSFYLHFKSKYEVLIPIVQQHASSLDERLQRSLAKNNDPAEVVAFSSRHLARALIADPLWLWFLKHSGVPVKDMRDAVGNFAARDFGKGLLSGRFKVPEIGVASHFILGAFIHSILASIDADNPHKTIDQMVEMMLRVLGIPLDEATEIAHRPLPPIGEI